jgi:ankyrin repeat protein
VKFLLISGAAVNIISDYGQTALILASHLGHSDIVAILINYGAKVNTVAHGGYNNYNDIIFYFNII